MGGTRAPQAKKSQSSTATQHKLCCGPLCGHGPGLGCAGSTGWSDGPW